MKVSIYDSHLILELFFPLSLNISTYTFEHKKKTTVDRLLLKQLKMGVRYESDRICFKASDRIRVKGAVWLVSPTYSNPKFGCTQNQGEQILGEGATI
jgi:hypothetical protein